MLSVNEPMGTLVPMELVNQALLAAYRDLAEGYVQGRVPSDAEGQGFNLNQFGLPAIGYVGESDEHVIDVRNRHLLSRSRMVVSLPTPNVDRDDDSDDIENSPRQVVRYIGLNETIPLLESILTSSLSSRFQLKPRAQTKVVLASFSLNALSAVWAYFYDQQSEVVDADDKVKIAGLVVIGLGATWLTKKIIDWSRSPEPVSQCPSAARHMGRTRTVFARHLLSLVLDHFQTMPVNERPQNIEIPGNLLEHALKRLPEDRTPGHSLRQLFNTAQEINRRTNSGNAAPNRDSAASRAAHSNRPG